MKSYDSLSEQERALHKILNDTTINVKFLDAVEVVQEISKINNALVLINAYKLESFEKELRQYKQNLLMHLEEI